MKVDLVDMMGTELCIVNAARVSFDKEAEYTPSGKLFDRDVKLIEYLARNNHWSPFTHVIAKFRVKAPIFVARQLVKHQVGLSWNEVSRRYVDSEPEFYVPEVWRKRAANVKQGSSDEPFTDYLFTEDDEGVDQPVERVVQRFYEEALYLYDRMIFKGIAPEQARMVLPASLMTEWIWTGSLYAWARVYNQRTDEHAQRECQVIAHEIGKHCSSLWPTAWEALCGTSS